MAAPVFAGDFSTVGQSADIPSNGLGVISPGDWLYACVVHVDQAADNTQNVPAGFIELSTDVFTFSGVFPSRVSLYRKLATASEPTTYNFSSGQPLATFCYMVRVTGAGGHVVAKLKDTTGNLTRFPSLSSASADSLVLLMGYARNADEAGWSNTAPAGTTRGNFIQNGFGAAWFTQALAGATGVKSVAQTTSATAADPNITFSIAIMPATGSSGRSASGGVSLAGPRTQAAGSFTDHAPPPVAGGTSPGTGIWDSARQNYEFIISNAGRTATHNRGYSAAGSIYANQGISSGDHSFTLTINSIAASGTLQLGLGNKTRSMTANLGWSANDVAVGVTGSISYQSANLGNVGAIVVGSVVEIRVKNLKLYVRRDGGLWNGSSTITPDLDNGPSIAAIPTTSGFEKLFPLIYATHPVTGVTADFSNWNRVSAPENVGQWADGQVSLKGPSVEGSDANDARGAATVPLSAPKLSGQAQRGASAGGGVSLAAPRPAAWSEHSRAASGSSNLSSGRVTASAAHGLAGSSQISLAPKIGANTLHSRSGEGVVSMVAPTVQATADHSSALVGAISVSVPAISVQAARGSRSESTVSLRGPSLTADAQLAVGANGQISLTQTVTGTSAHGQAAEGQISLTGPSLSALATYRRVADAMAYLNAPEVSGEACRGNISDSAITLTAPTLAATVELRSGAGAAISLNAPTVSASAGVGSSASAVIQIGQPVTNAAALLVPRAAGEISLRGPRTNGVISTPAYSVINLAAPKVAADGLHGAQGYGVVELASARVAAVADRGAQGSAAISLSGPMIAALADPISVSDGFVALNAPMIGGVFEHSIGGGGAILLTLAVDGLWRFREQAYDLYVDPLRVVMVPADSRMVFIPSDQRLVVVPADPRRVTVPFDGRIVTVPNDDRTGK